VTEACSAHPPQATTEPLAQGIRIRGAMRAYSATLTQCHEDTLRLSAMALSGLPRRRLGAVCASDHPCIAGPTASAYGSSVRTELALSPVAVMLESSSAITEGMRFQSGRGDP
jgi:hypothetical protein